MESCHRCLMRRERSFKNLLSIFLTVFLLAARSLLLRIPNSLTVLTLPLPVFRNFQLIVLSLSILSFTYVRQIPRSVQLHTVYLTPSSP